MIAFLKGTLAGKTLTSIYIDVHGVGYEVGMSTSNISKLPDVGQSVEVFTYLQVREDAMALFGFTSMEEKELFLKLIGVSGIGPKVALAALSFYSPAQLVDAIAAQDTARVSKIPGVGKKTAQRIILELKGSIDQGLGGLFAQEDLVPAAGSADAVKGATEVLLSMGFTSAEAELALKGAPADAGETALIQYGLKRLGSL